jgi:predicted RNA-binding protein YlqC (UPF0109 family)
MKNLLEYLVIHLVSHPEDVSIDEREDDRGTVYVIHVHQEDMGRVIGKGGSVIQAIRTIAKIRAIKEGIRAYVTLADEARDSQDNATAAPTESTDTSAEDLAGEPEDTQE